MQDIETELQTILTSDAQLTGIIGSRVYFLPNLSTINPTYPFIAHEYKQTPIEWADNNVSAYKSTITIHILTTGVSFVIKNHIERIMTAAGHMLDDSGHGEEPDCYRDYMVFTKIKEV